MILSIIVPVFNVKDYLEKCVNSLIDKNLTKEDYEIILVDDGSTDGVSNKICDKLAKKYKSIVKVIHQKNKGIGGARNTGIKESKGEYLFFVDSDDTVLPNTPSFLIKKIKETEADIISFNFFTDKCNGKLDIIKTNYVHRNNQFTLNEFPDYLLSQPSSWNRVLKKELFVKNKLKFPSKVIYEDIRTIPKIFTVAKSIVTIDKPLYIYLQRPDSIMHASKLERNKEIMDAFDDLICWFKKKNIFDKYYEQICKLALWHIFLTASVRVLKQDPKHHLLNDFQNYIKARFPDYKRFKYENQISKKRKIIYKLLQYKQYKLIKFIFKITEHIYD